MIIITCKSCAFNNKVVFNQKLAGKSVMFACKNPSCNKPVKFSFPSKEPTLVGKDTVITNADESDYINACIEWKHKSGETISFPISNQTNIIGRQVHDQDIQIAIPTQDRTMSRQHAIIEKDKFKSGYSYLLKEHNNKNPISINSQELIQGFELYLQDGDQITMGRTSLIFKLVN